MSFPDQNGLRAAQATLFLLSDVLSASWSHLKSLKKIVTFLSHFCKLFFIMHRFSFSIDPQRKMPLFTTS
jgi:hypothetical protein